MAKKKLLLLGTLGAVASFFLKLARSRKAQWPTDGRWDDEPAPKNSTGA